MAFFESPRFPERIAYGALGGPEWSTEVVATTSGEESRDAAWAYPRHSWDVSQGLRNAADFAALRAFFLVAQGKRHGWRFKDWTDFQATTADGVLMGCTTAGVATAALGGPAARLVKRYSSGGQYLDRLIRKPVAGTVVLRNGATILAAPADYALDTTTGIVTWVARATATVNVITLGASTQLELLSTLTGVGVGDRIWVSGLGGADAADLNDQVWTVSGVSGSTYTIPAATTGKTINVTGTPHATFYPGGDATDALNWFGEFDVPMRFDTDALRASIEARNPTDGLLMRWDSIPVLELKRP